MDYSSVYQLHRLIYKLDRIANNHLQKNFGISFHRALFLIMLEHHQPITQHQLATALGFSDPAASVMVRELGKTGHVTASPDPEHGRRRLVRLTSSGTEMAQHISNSLSHEFATLVCRAKIDDQALKGILDKLLAALIAYENEVPV